MKVSASSTPVEAQDHVGFGELRRSPRRAEQHAGCRAVERMGGGEGGANLEIGDHHRAEASASRTRRSQAPGSRVARPIKIAGRLAPDREAGRLLQHSQIRSRRGDGPITREIRHRAVAGIGRLLNLSIEIDVDRSLRFRCGIAAWRAAATSSAASTDAGWSSHFV